jgi:hypothetical protein
MKFLGASFAEWISRGDKRRQRILPSILFACFFGVSLWTATEEPEHNNLTVEEVETLNVGDTAWLLTASAFVLFMTPGLSFFYGGMVRAKNVLSTMFQGFFVMAIISVVWVIVGFSLAFGDSLSGYMGHPSTFYMLRHVGGAPTALSGTIPLALFAIFQMKFALITPALIIGMVDMLWQLGIFRMVLSLFACRVFRGAHPVVCTGAILCSVQRDHLLSHCPHDLASRGHSA